MELCDKRTTFAAHRSTSTSPKAEQLSRSLAFARARLHIADGALRARHAHSSHV
eukprot:CAMPEP_0203903826 /NCGR_PEP_ID=MMETSP0359-20131031/45710_1 /ASSEMBLY_ACC=CAM_ASM_000338 /TAXON_ID=268821 /ORGANISM="Scrippsiella Hangoei, Strain SHTV-5" /LENGTH=53 /DNA_ID=CAMNT_0050827933 /DNA_START=1 /DNA_END=158 /DNA_ORIENTATION=+